MACPFCRELYSLDEATVCPACDLPLVRLEQLPLSADGQQEAAAWGPTDPPEDQRLPWTYWGRGRGPLAALAAAGLGLFFAPWVSLELPEAVALSGFDLARSGAPWLWGGAVGWFLTVPLAISRRSVNELRGVRVISATFAIMTLAEVSLLWLKPPAENVYFDSGLSWAWGSIASFVVSLAATVVAARLGGDPADLRDLPLPIAPRAQDERRATDTLH